MTDHKCQLCDTPHGFMWCDVEVMRVAEIDGRHVIAIIGGHEVNVYVSPTGRSMRVFRDGRELK